MEGAAAPVPSQASSHFPLEPVSGATLFDQEKGRRDGLGRRGNCLTGCRELDHEVLMGGFERGCVVGISAEEEEVGLLIGLQTIANLFVADLLSGDKTRAGPRAMIITTLPMGALLPMLRAVFKAQLVVHGKVEADFTGLLKKFLERISISRVFDVSGLWEALGELDSLVGHDRGGQEPPDRDYEETAGRRDASAEGGEETARLAAEPLSSPLSDPPSNLSEDFELDGAALAHQRTPPGQRAEIADSEDEGGGFSSPLSPTRDSPKPPVDTVAEEKPTGRQPGKRHPFSSEQRPGNEGPSRQEDSIHPDIILITHISTLMSTLFRQREKDTAHQTLQFLSSHLRYLTRSPDHGGPLVMVLNSTTSPTDTTANDNNNDNITTAERPQDRDRPPRPAEPGATIKNKTSRPLDPTLRSIFNPPPPPVSGLNYYAYDTPLSRRNKPSFGLVFTQLLDIHLLCTSVPKTRADAEALFAPPPPLLPGQVVHGGGRSGAVEYGWVVEVLLDEIGVWDGDGVGGGKTRRSREQRWGAVIVSRGGGSGDGGDGVRVVDAFEKGEKVVGEIRLAGGFGGRRV